MNLNIDDQNNNNHTSILFNRNCENIFLYNSCNVNKKFLVVHQNIRSLRENFDLLVCNLEAFVNVPDLIFVSEIWIYKCEMGDFNIPGYKFYAITNENYASGGVGCFIKQEYICSVDCYNFVSSDILKLTFTIGKDQFTFLCIYRFHTHNVKVFLDEFSQFLDGLTTSNLVILGDFNINILDVNVDVSNYLALMAFNGLTSVINDPTRLVSGKCIDHIFVRFSKIPISGCDSGIFDLKITDHCMIGILVNDLPKNKEERFIPFPRKTIIDHSKLRLALIYEFWEVVYAEDDASKAFDIFTNTFKNYINDCSSSVRPTKCDKRLKPWINRFILNKINYKNKLRLKCAKHPLNIRLKYRYNRLCKYLRKEIPKCRDNFFKNELLNNKGDIKKEWKVINSVLNKCPNSRKEISLLDCDNEVITDPLEIANKFNDHFSSSATNLVPDSSVPMCACCNNYGEHYQRNSYFFEPFSAMEILETIKSLKNTNSCGQDGISNILLKNVALYIVDILKYLLNKSVYCGIFPEALKSANVLPLFKKGDPKETNNYRPISILPSISKIFEKLMKNRVVKFLNKNNFFSSKQFGFRKGRSTEDALLDFCSKIYVNLDSKKNAAGLFVDITKAFDMVNHDLLLEKISNAGFRGFMLDWFRSYLCNRSQKVVINGIMSKINYLNLGVPQGSVLGPILFLIYINSLFYQNFKGDIIAFADDLGCAYSSNNVLDLVSDINFDLNLLRNWFTAHKLVISDKTKIMYFSLTGQNAFKADVMFHAPECCRFKLVKHNCAFSSNDKTFYEDLQCSRKCFIIETVRKFKYLGLTIDNKMTWTDHTESLKQYFRSTIRSFYRLKQICSPGVLKIIYYGIFQSKLQYGISCWGGAFNNKIQPLLVLQKYVIRKICNKSRLCHSLPLFQYLKILPVRHLYCFKVLKTFFIRSGYLNHRISNGYPLRINNRFLVNVPSFHTTTFRNFYDIISCRLFNKLPQPIRMLRSPKAFVRGIKQWLLNFEFETLVDVLN